MAQSFTWKFYLTAGRTWGGPRISGASITAYSTQTGSTVLKALVTDASGYTSYTLTGARINPGSYYWRVNLGNMFGDYYGGKNIVGYGTTSGYYGTPSTALNTSGTAFLSPGFNSLTPNATGTITIHLFVVGQSVTIPSSKFLTNFDVIALAPPTINFLPARPSTMVFNKCITESEMRDYDNKGAFKVSPIFYDTTSLIDRGTIQEYTSFISGTSATPSLSTTSLAFTYDSTASTKTVTATVPSGFVVGYSITGTSRSYFRASISQTDSKTFHFTVYPTNTNYTTSARVATLVVIISKKDSDAWFGGSMTSATVALTQGYYQSGGSSGGTTGGGSQT